MSDLWIRVKLRGLWEGPPQPGGARPGPEQTFYEADWLVPFVPVAGDTLMLPDGSERGQGVTVTERVLTLEGHVELWVGGWDADWDKELLDELWRLTRERAVAREQAWEEESREPMQLMVGESLATLYRLARRAEAQGAEDASWLRVTVPEGAQVPQVEDDVLVVDAQDRTCVARVLKVSPRRIPRPHTAVVIDVDWPSLGI
jgi:hypothetical protein